VIGGAMRATRPVVTPNQVQAMPPVERQHLADQCRRIAALPSRARKALLSKGERSPTFRTDAQHLERIEAKLNQLNDAAQSRGLITYNGHNGADQPARLSN
jgi:hypothetical protein